MTRLLKSVLAVLVAVALLGGAAGAHSFTSGYYYGYGTIVPLGPGAEGSHLLKSAAGATLAVLQSSKYDLAQWQDDYVRVSGWTTHTTVGHAALMTVSSLTVLVSSRHTIAYKYIEKGNWTHWPVPVSGGNYVIRDAATWDKWFAIHGMSEVAYAIDWSKYMVLALFMGEQPTTGYSFKINRVARSGDRTFVDTTKVYPGPEPTPTKTRPYVFLRVSKAAGYVYFNGSKADALPDTARLSIFGHVTLGPGVDPSNVKVGVFSAIPGVDYFMWPGNLPGDVTPLADDGTYNKTFSVPMPDASGGAVFYVIVWEDVEGDGLVGGNAHVTTLGYYYSGGAWHLEGVDGNFFIESVLTIDLSLTH